VTLRSIAILAAALTANSGCVQLDLGSLGGQAEWVEQVVLGDEGPKILLLDVEGVIGADRDSGPFGLGRRQGMVERVRSQLELAEEDDDVKALLLRIDSPGGTVTASDVIHREILEFKKRTKLPVVAQMMGVAASGGYYVAMAADHVRAHPTTLTGSIGVIFSGVNASGLMEKIGLENQTLTTGPFKDTGTALRPMRADEREQLQSVLDDFVSRFRSVVVEGRPALDAEAVAGLSDGRVFTADQALAAGLVDAVGYLPEAVEETERRADLEESQVVIYHRSDEWRENLYSASPISEPRAGLPGPLAWLLRPAFLYLWWPGLPGL
jgi:protease-4